MDTDRTVAEGRIDAAIEAEPLLRRLAGVRRAKKQAKASYDAVAERLRAQETALEAALEAIVARYGPVTTISGTAKIGRSTTTNITGSVLIEWAMEHRPGLLRPPTLTSLTEAGARWHNGTLVLETGEIVPGVVQEHTPALRCTLSSTPILNFDDDDEETD